MTRIAEDQKLGKRLVRGHPVIEAEVLYCMRNEMCETAEDFIARRTRLAFVDSAACAQALPKVMTHPSYLHPDQMLGEHVMQACRVGRLDPPGRSLQSRILDETAGPATQSTLHATAA